MRRHFIAFFFIVYIDSIVSWENYELDLFDLVEELGLSNNFYDFLGVDKNVESNDIKRAYRKLSLIWHPDKSDDPNAEQKFRQLVAVYEILKDEQRRARYDQILVEGLPKWHQPLYYYRRARKLRFWEILTILTLITTIGHYLVLWAMYFESSLTMNERSAEMRKRIEKKMKKMSKTREIDQDQIDEEMARILPQIHTPELSAILPIKLAHFLVDHQFFIPLLKRLLCSLFSGCRRQSTLDEDDLTTAETESITISKRSQVVRMVDIVPEMATSLTVPVVSYTTSIGSPSAEETNNKVSEFSNSNRTWSDEEKQLLCKAVVRFPPGTPRRWEKIAEVIGRHISQVTEMAKKLQSTVGVTGVGSQENQSSFSTPTKIDQNLITEREQSEPPSDWSKMDQQLLECALKNIPKDVPGIDRWEQIARCVPGKSRDECLARYRYIAQRIRAKKIM